MKLFKLTDIQGTKVLDEKELAEFTEMICRDYDVESLDDADIDCESIRNPMEATSLGDLMDIIRDWEDVENSDEYFSSAEFPTFGKPYKNDTSGIWSWDDDDMIVGETFSDMKIVPRNDK